ncbi:hypothetical protein EV426DRAFT_282268 [Tirmania nivea]|nr:hypothetical protein EV426DRAFT_282268 [Tirmania nivea]
MKPRPLHFPPPPTPHSILRRDFASINTRTPNILGYRLPPPRPNGPPAVDLPQTSTPLPLSPLLEFPTHYLPYSKRKPKLRPIPGPNRPPTELSAKLKTNPYARILATPARNAFPHQLRLPAFLLVRLGVLRRPETKGAEGKESGGVYMLPTNLLPETRNRQTTMQGIHVACRRSVFSAMMKKGAWKKLIPDEGSRGAGNVKWRGDMPVYVERGIRRRVVWELMRMVKVLPGKGVVEVRNGLTTEDGKEPEVGCILSWKSPEEGITLGGDTLSGVSNGIVKGNRNPRYLQPTGMLRTLSSGKTVPVHDISAMFPTADELSTKAGEVKELLGLDPAVEKAAILMHHQTVKAQMWLMKLRYYLS